MSKVYIAGPFSKPRTRKALQKMIDIAAERYGRNELYVPMEYKVPGDFQKLDGTWKKTESYFYDEHNRLEKIDYGEGRIHSTIKYKYDSSGRLVNFEIWKKQPVKIALSHFWNI